MRELRESLEVVLKDTHYSFYVRQWVDYKEVKQNRVKLLHDVRLDNGEEYEGYYPNGNSWNKFIPGDGPSRLEDDDVTHIRISLKQTGDR